jgi:cell division protein FtsQ
MRLPTRPRAARLSPGHARLIAAVVLLTALATGAWLWFRDSGLVRVREVTVTGATASDAPQVRAALEEAARGMSTLHVREDALNAAVAPYASVARVEASADFPHRLAIQVTERRAVAAIDAGGHRVPVTGSGLVLRGVQPPAGLPAVMAPLGTASARITDARTLAGIAVAAAAPAPLLRRTTRVWWGPRGLTIDLSRGPSLIFGSAGEAAPKWSAAARVLAEPSAAGATYLDLRVPGRVGAGGLAPVTEEDPDGDANDTPVAPSTSP